MIGEITYRENNFPEVPKTSANRCGNGCVLACAYQCMPGSESDGLGGVGEGGVGWGEIVACSAP